MKHKLLISLILLIYVASSFAANADSTSSKISIGLTGGLSQNWSNSIDIYGGSVITIRSKKLEVNCGYTHFKNITDYQSVSELEFSSHGVFAESNIYFTEGFFAGLRYAVNFNWVDKLSQEKFEAIPETDAPTFFSGTAGYGQLGYHQQLGRIGIKVQGQIGIHNYKIAEGWLLIDSSSSDVINSQLGIERHSQLLYNLSVGLTFKL